MWRLLRRARALRLLAAGRGVVAARVCVAGRRCGCGYALRMEQPPKLAIDRCCAWYVPVAWMAPSCAAASERGAIV